MANKQRNETPERLIFSEKFACPVSGFTIPEIEPRLFSFNNPFGACPACDGLGVAAHIDPELVVPDEDTHAAQAARSRRGRRRPRPITRRRSRRSASTTKFKLDTPWKDLPEKAQDVILLRHRRGRDHLRL